MQAKGPLEPHYSKPDGRPLAYASRVLTASESTYAQFQKELLAIEISTEKLHQYTYVRSVTVESDLKPIETILAKLLISASKSVQKIVLRLQPCDLDVG